VCLYSTDLINVLSFLNSFVFSLNTAVSRFGGCWVVARSSELGQNRFMPNLTKRFVESAQPGPTPIILWDDQLAGFGVKILPNGRRRYIIKYRVGGGRAARQRWYLAGTHGQITCEQAREIAVQVLAAVAKGEDPQGERAKYRSARPSRTSGSDTRPSICRAKSRAQGRRIDKRLEILLFRPSAG
jgi:hypothetical protein